jgi:hypothetical protein
VLQLGQRILEHAAMPGIMSVFELLQNVLPGKAQALKFALPGSFRGRHCDAVRAGLFGSVRLLSLNRFAFPASCHSVIIIPPRTALLARTIPPEGLSVPSRATLFAGLPSNPGCHAPRTTALEHPMEHQL